ncbi:MULTISPECIES: Holliday junction resolvase Hjc [Metallosphaera]|uniref:Holliday junction resolvase n=3 Tax=Metallosphaera TaxID=41980 RepID=A4YFD7_METS5|nr:MULTISPECIES: Holliday junction resolvase Hjc [Metallosphaera]ABP95139.1 holliday junction resolvase [Metallosphaera sedula DSM 5348]AIM27125.1 holliday junction resolvase [Metallosphaera sedula]AKV74032.1 endonuclease [Metallosphaera sedula]AKV76271.1 endonuclease [Metallosphaera sedula]AKV78523.1 endonuclease [Metallosphaera sedula]
MNKEVGRNAERELVSIFREAGFNAVRIPTSNSSSNPLPDLFATKGNLLVAVEAKSTWENKVKVRSLQVEKLLNFLAMFPMKGIPIIAVKFKGIREWRYVVVEKAGDVVVDIINSRPIEEILNMSFPREVSSHIQEEIQA